MTDGTPRKPNWMLLETYQDIMAANPDPRCEYCGVQDALEFDHIVPRSEGGTNDRSNLQILCGTCNKVKSKKPDRYWYKKFYWDQPINAEGLWTAQRVEAYERIREHAEWFTQPWSVINQVLYTLVWVVGSGKTLAIPSLAAALNHTRLERLGPACPRVDRILVLTKDESIRDQIVKSLREDVTEYGLWIEPPRVGKYTDGFMFDDPGLEENFDIVVACIQQLFWKRPVDGSSKVSQPRKNLSEILARFGLIILDEPHWAEDQVMSIVESATRSLCFGTTGSPIDAKGKLRERLVLFSRYTYQNAIDYDESLKWLDRDQTFEDQFIEIVRINRADILEEAQVWETLTTDVEGYDKALEAAKSVISATLRHVNYCDMIHDGNPARHRRSDLIANLWYPVHALIETDVVEIGRQLVKIGNEMCLKNPHLYPRSKGYWFDIVHSSSTDAEGRRLKARPLDDEHPWILAHDRWRHGKRDIINEDCIRFLVVVGMVREGANNPFCGVVAEACKGDSLVTKIQRLLGRQLRAVLKRGTDRRAALVPPEALDRVKIITHEAYGNIRAIRRAIDFVCDMESWTDALITMQKLMDGIIPPGLSDTEGESTLTIREKLDILKQLGQWKLQGDPIDQDHILERWDTVLPAKRDKIEKFVDRALDHPEVVRDELHFTEDIHAEPVVIREDPFSLPSDAELESFIRIQFPEHIPYLADLSTNRRILQTIWSQYADRHRIGDVQRFTDLEKIRNGFAREIRGALGQAFTGQYGDLRSAVGYAVKLKLGTRGEPARNDSKWDIPACHILLARPEVRQEIIGFSYQKLVRWGKVPSIAEILKIETEDRSEEDHGEE